MLLPAHEHNSNENLFQKIAAIKVVLNIISNLLMKNGLIFFLCTNMFDRYQISDLLVVFLSTYFFHFAYDFI